MKSNQNRHEDVERLIAIIRQKSGQLLWTRLEDGRWFQVCVSVDLFDTLLLQTLWGGARKKGAGTKTFLLNLGDQLQCNRVAWQICSRRKRHGYTLASEFPYREGAQ
jgi:hypothetical protein